jgi:hypothetical protein
MSVVAPEDELKIRMRGATALLEVAIDMVQRGNPNALVQLAVVVVEEDGSGTIAVTLDPSGFLSDLRTLVGNDDE